MYCVYFITVTSKGKVQEKYGIAGMQIVEQKGGTVCMCTTTADIP